MCMMIHHPATAEPFTRAEFDDIFFKNRAGFGIIWRWPSGAISQEKGMWSPDRIWSTYKALLDHGCEEMVLHWRYATSGPRDLANCHPFETNGVLIAHNGVLSHRSTRTDSDTRCFIADVIAPSLRALGTERSIGNPVWRLWLARKIGGGNRLILWPRTARRPTIVSGDRAPVTYRGRWYSNTYAWSAPREVRWARFSR